MGDIKLIEPHDVISRKVTGKDVKRVMKDAIAMVGFCNSGNGIYPRGYAVAHSQITKDDPLRFFVKRSGQVIINPRIVKKTRHQKLVFEGCLSFPYKKKVSVGRSYKCEVLCGTVEDDELTDEVIWVVKGIEAQIVQHELQHMNAEYIYNYDKE